MLSGSGCVWFHGINWSLWKYLAFVLHAAYDRVHLFIFKLVLLCDLSLIWKWNKYHNDITATTIPLEVEIYLSWSVVQIKRNCDIAQIQPVQLLECNKLKSGSCHDADFVIADVTGSFHYDNLWCYQLRQNWHKWRLLASSVYNAYTYVHNFADFWLVWCFDIWQKWYDGCKIDMSRLIIF